MKNHLVLWSLSSLLSLPVKQALANTTYIYRECEQPKELTPTLHPSIILCSAQYPVDLDDILSNILFLMLQSHLTTHPCSQSTPIFPATIHLYSPHLLRAESNHLTTSPLHASSEEVELPLAWNQRQSFGQVDRVEWTSTALPALSGLSQMKELHPS